MADQFNIMALTGNGFDIQVMNKYNQSVTSQYQNFYHFMKMKRGSAKNIILQEMEQAMSDGKHDWSDIEECIARLVDRGVWINKIQESLDEVRKYFSEFLNSAVSPTLLTQLSDDAQGNIWSHNSLSHFLSDIKYFEDLRKIPFGARKGNYDFYNFCFINFNYTSLLDNYIYLDSKQFDPRPHSTVDTNFEFNTDPRVLSGDNSWNFNSSSYVETQVVHPHGYQDIPRSLLFGIQGDGNSRGMAARLSKPYWARVQQRYAHLFDQTCVFIIFGCSLGVTDSWWWEKIATALSDASESERALIIYWWNASSDKIKSDEDVRALFFKNAKVEISKQEDLSKKICVVSYTDQDDRVWLSTS